MKRYTRGKGGMLGYILSGIASGFLTLGSGCAPLTRDLDTYRTHAVEQSSRESLENLDLALKRLNASAEGLFNVISIGYGTDRFEKLRKNDFKYTEQCKNFGKKWVETGKNACLFLYSLPDVLDDLMDLHLLPDAETSYGEIETPMRPFVYLGKTICDSVECGVEAANVPTFGLADNVAGAAYTTLEEAIEALKLSGQGGTNIIIRTPTRALLGPETAERAIDWVALVPLEYVSNVLQAQGFSNMMEYRKAIEEKGYTFTLLEFGGDAYLLYELLNEDHDTGIEGGEQGPGPTPPDPF